MKAVIYDYETLGTDGNKNVILSLAALEFDIGPGMNYDYKELVDSAKYIKFDVASQVKKYGRLINKDTVRWWSEQGESAQKVLKPSEDDADLSEVIDFFGQFDFNKTRYVLTRGDMDPLFTKSFYELFKLPPAYAYYKWRDTRSLIDGLSMWHIKDNYTPDTGDCEVVLHDARYDIALDVMRIQQIVQA